jgi:hypothetical protein
MGPLLVGENSDRYRKVLAWGLSAEIQEKRSRQGFVFTKVKRTVDSGIGQHPKLPKHIPFTDTETHPKGIWHGEENTDF